LTSHLTTNPGARELEKRWAFSETTVVARIQHPTDGGARARLQRATQLAVEATECPVARRAKKTFVTRSATKRESLRRTPPSYWTVVTAEPKDIQAISKRCPEVPTPEIPPEEAQLEEAYPAQPLLDAVDAALVPIQGLGVAEVTRGAVPAGSVLELYKVRDLVHRFEW